MPRAAFYFLFILLLTVAACATLGPDPSPAPRLEGNWQGSSTETTVYNSDGSVQSRSDLVPTTATTTYNFTATTLTTATAGSPPRQYTYSQAGNVLTLVSTTNSLALPFTQAIVQLTPTTLALQSTMPSTVGGTIAIVVHFVR